MTSCIMGDQANGQQMRFPLILHFALYMIERMPETETKMFGKSISWVREVDEVDEVLDGQVFTINDHSQFMREVASRFFPKQSCFRSFERQLYGWGFQRIASIPGRKSAWYHPCFVKGKPELLRFIKRVAPTRRITKLEPAKTSVQHHDTDMTVGQETTPVPLAIESPLVCTQHHIGTSSNIAALQQTKEFKFPLGLRAILDDAEKLLGLDVGISWSSHGKSFVIRDKDFLMKQVAPNYFPNQTKYPSFRRQLYNWGFKPIKGEKGAWMHEHFIRGQPNLISLIEHRKMRGIKY